MSAFEQMPPEQRAKFAEELRAKLDTHRITFVVDRFSFEPFILVGTRVKPEAGAPRKIMTADNTVVMTNEMTEQKTVSAAALRLLLDYCENEWPMGFVEYCAAIFHAREPTEGETAFDLLPDHRNRLNADRLGFGHIYGSTEET